MATATKKAMERTFALLASEGITISIRDTVDNPRWRDYHGLNVYRVIARRPAERGRPNVFTYYHPTHPGAERPTAWDVACELGLHMLQMLDVSSFDSFCDVRGITGTEDSPEDRAGAERMYAADLAHTLKAEDFLGSDTAIDLMEIVDSWIAE